MKKRCFLLPILMLCLCVSCWTSRTQPNTQENITLEIEQIAKGKDFGLIAKAEGMKVHIRLMNNTDSKVPVSALNFAVVVYDRIHVFDTDKAFAKFPIIDLEPASQAVGNITFYGITETDNLVGFRLIFNDGKHKPTYTVIQQARVNSKSKIKN